ncbi:MAG: hypothetical protein DDT40_01547 [candidate division WS2 bacterium]|uniref:Uncharacterized protein n=1 Tax=Psychracetigena formicireducens TaxID=2986056 RepID=A0A9E2BHE7_PSYF1|nr:hypothetical protein [Candidatus Psychracetigena formicireducens]MBT9151354.1 hypothetical protein [Candidatus Psychracetigena formicireducens]
MPEMNSNQTSHLDEARDVHPIFRANPFLIQEGLKLVRGEKYLSSEELKHIDLLFEDKDKIPTFVEVKWSDVSESQMSEYRRLVDRYHPKSRLIWAIPNDLAAKASVASKYGIEVKLFDREKIIQIKDLQDKANEYLKQITSLLSSSFKITMHGESISFENPVVACYFEGRATTDRGQKKLGLKQQSIGRQLDLIKNLTIGHVAEFHKEKILLLIWEVFKAPYSYKPGKFWRIIDEGFIELIKERQERDIEKLAMKIWELVNQYYNKFASPIKTIYNMDVKKYDLLAMLLFQLAEGNNKTVFSIDELIKSIIDEFEIKPSQPTPKIKHSILNQWIENIVSVKDYENDMAKRLLEIAALKRMLIPKMGTVDMWILTPSKKTEGFVAQRQPCQMLSFNKDTSLYIGIEQYHKKEG